MHQKTNKKICKDCKTKSDCKYYEKAIAVKKCDWKDLNND